MIRERLAGRRILLTGVTGFLGQAVLERLLSRVPEARPVLLVRPQGSIGAADRVTQLLAGQAFSALREAGGSDWAKRTVRERIEVVEGDITGELPELPEVDLAVHCAATVSFDPPVDEAFRINTLGTRSLYEALGREGRRPHVVHVSTAYVAGITRGTVDELPLDHDVDWRAETQAAMAARISAEEASRTPERLEWFLSGSGRAHRRAGPVTVSRDAERRRAEWVERRLVRTGQARARTLGWPDVYTFTKALGERVGEEAAADGFPISIVRPSIIESALRDPFPGWIEGFKMAEPIILGYGRGAIPEFPGIPEGIIDVIPVDLVAHAILAVAATPPPEGQARHYHVCSGARNAISYRELFGHVRDYFRAHPLPEHGRGEVKVPDWSFPGRTQVDRLLRLGDRALRAVDRAVGRIPRSKRLRSAVRRLDRERRRLDFVKKYADLYGPYAEAEVIYTDDRTKELWDALREEDRRDFPFDAADIDWRHYMEEVHCPSVTTMLRITTPRRPDPAVRITERPSALAAFDLEGTILNSNVVEAYLWLRLADVPPERWAGEVARLARAMPKYLAAERRDRGQFLRSFYRRYEGASADGLREVVRERVADLVLRAAWPAAIRRVREHRRAGHRTVLITGALEAFVEPLKPLFDDMLATSLVERDGRLTGYLDKPPAVGEARVAWLRSYAEANDLDLNLSYAYGDSHSDLPLLQVVGHPVAVNPDVALYRAARRNRWPVEEWSHLGGSTLRVPEPVP